jgi:hypothetical protein
MPPEPAELPYHSKKLAAVSGAGNLIKRLRMRYDQDRDTARKLLLRLLGDKKRPSETLIDDVCTACLRIWHVVHSTTNKMVCADQKTKVCAFEDMTVVVIYRMQFCGLNVRLSDADNDNEDPLELLPVVPFLQINLPNNIEAERDLGIQCKTIISKVVLTALTSLPAAELRALANEFGRLRFV